MATDAGPGAGGAGPARDGARWIGPALALACLASLPFLVHPWYDATYDGSMYVSLARSLLAGEGYTYLGEPFQVRPPGFPVLLVPVLAVFGTSFVAWNAYVALWGVAAVLLFFAFERPRLGAGLAGAAALALWLSPPWQTLCNQTLSEMPATALLFATLLLDRRWGRTGSAGRHLVLGLAIGLAAYVRTVNVLVAPAAIAARLLRPRQPGGPGAAERLGWRGVLLRQVLPLAAGVVLALAPWSVRNATTDFPVPPDQYPLHSYSAAMWHVDKGDPGSPRISLEQFGERVALRAPQCVAALGSGLRRAELGAPEAVVAALLLLATAFYGLRERGTAELFALGTFALLCVYFGFAERLLLPVYVVAAPCLLRALGAGLERLARGAPMRPALATGLLLVALWDARPREGWDRIRARHETYARRAAEVTALVPPGARLATSIGHHYSVHLGRPVRSFRVSGRRDPDSSTIAAVDAIQRHGVERVFLFEDVVTDATLIQDLGKWYGVEAREGGTLVIDVTPPLDPDALIRGPADG